MRVLHAYNLHRAGGGSDNATLASIAVLREGGVEVHEFARDSRTVAPNILGKLKVFSDGIYPHGAVREFAHALESQKPDIVHVHEVYPLLSPWILRVCAEARIPAVMSAYDFRMTCPIATHHYQGHQCHKCVGGREYWCAMKNCRDSLPESIAYAARNAVARGFGLFERYVDRFVVMSTFSQEWMNTQAHIPAERLVKIPPAIRVPETSVDPTASRYVAFAGRFVPEKGVEVMVAACRRLGLPMAFAGDEITHTAVTSDDDAYFVLTRSPEELADFYRQARVVVVPSLFYETFNIVAAEAMSHGVPVIASRLGALSETVRDNETGLLFAPGDVDELCEHLQRLWNDDALCRSLGENARQRVVDDFTEEAHFMRLTALYRELVSSCS